MMHLLTKAPAVAALFLAISWLIMPAPTTAAGVNWNAPLAIIDSNECDLDTPDRFWVTEIGVDFISVEWDPVPGAQRYFLEVFESNTSNVITSASVTTTFATLYVPPGGTYDIKLSAVAEGCPPSSNYVMIQDIIALIIDLTINGRSLPACTEEIPVTPNGDLIWPTDPTPASIWFRIDRNGIPISAYEITISPISDSGSGCSGEGQINIGQSANIRPGTNSFAIIQGAQFEELYPPCYSGIQRVLIQTSVFQVVNLFKLNLSGMTTNGGTINVANMVGENYSYVFLNKTCGPPPPPFQGGEESRSATFIKDVSSPISIQNPFTDHIQIYTPQPAPALVTFQIFSLNGSTVLEQQYPASHEYKLPTTSLPPGFYLLRMETDGISRTFKMVKAQ